VVGDNQYEVINRDCIEGMADMPPACIEFSVYSPPFNALYAYNSSVADIGNSEGLDREGDGILHLAFFYRQIVRVMKPGRVMLVHVAQIPRMKRNSPQGGTIDFRGINIRIAERAGFIYDYDWVIRKAPQAQAIRTKSRGLQFAGMESDRSKCHGARCDYLIKFLAPGENAVPICDQIKTSDEDREDFAIEQAYDVQVTRNNWIDWAEGTWSDIRETDTLNGEKGKREVRKEDDTKHIAPLQLGLIHRAIRLFSNPGELVLDPFSGIGSTGYEAIKLGRRYFGFELRKDYYEASLRHLDRVSKMTVQEKSMSLFQDEPEPSHAVLD